MVMYHKSFIVFIEVRDTIDIQAFFLWSKTKFRNSGSYKSVYV